MTFPFSSLHCLDHSSAPFGIHAYSILGILKFPNCLSSISTKYSMPSISEIGINSISSIFTLPQTTQGDPLKLRVINLPFYWNYMFIYYLNYCLKSPLMNPTLHFTDTYTGLCVRDLEGRNLSSRSRKPFLFPKFSTADQAPKTSITLYWSQLIFLIISNSFLPLSTKPLSNSCRFLYILLWQRLSYLFLLFLFL